MNLFGLSTKHIIGKNSDILNEIKTDKLFMSLMQLQKVHYTLFSVIFKIIRENERK